jgi:hypothetical protein
MTFADQDPDPEEPDDNVPGWFSWPNVPIIGVTLGTVLGWYKAWRNE